MRIQDTVAEALLNAALGGAAFTPDATMYAGLVTAGPDSDGSGFVEVAGGAYARIAKVNNVTNFPACTAGSRQKLNGTVITWPTATASWGAILGVVLFAASSGGVCKFYAPFPAPETVNTGNVLSLAVGQLKFTLLATP